MTPEEIFDKLKEKFGEGKILRLTLPSQNGFEVCDPFIDVEPLAMTELADFLKHDKDLAFDQCCCISGVDLKDDLQVVYHLFSMSKLHKICIKATAKRDNPIVGTTAHTWGVANWLERETWDMFGIKFKDHPDHRRILLEEDWEGFPLRKDYKFPRFWRGMEVTPEEEEGTYGTQD